MRKLAYLILLLVWSNCLMIAQNCDDYHLKKCATENKEFKLSNQSRSGLFKKGHSSTFSFLAMKGYEYNIQLCCDDNLEDIILTVSHSDDDHIFSLDHGEKFVNLVAKMKTELTVKVDVPKADINIESVPYKDLYGCVGIRIEYARYEE
ncbi:MAG: hypothetical protein PF517_12395 [Salinivirgaceae bacterium]|jgi:hypothetical protein|nr:hypothetical protein [Salinivirgaceae bacterium]